MEAIDNSNIARILAEKQNGIISHTEFANFFIFVLDEHFK